MNFKWRLDLRNSCDTSTDWDLEVDDADETHIAFVRHHKHTGLYTCRFMPLEDNEFPDGKQYKTLKAAKAWCLKHAPVMYIAHKAGDNDGA